MALNIVVLIKQVPNHNNLVIDKATGTIVRDGVENIINPHDLYSIELALNLKEKYNATISIMTMGPPQAEIALREGLAMGVDNAILISDSKFAYSDTLQTTIILKEAFEIIKDFDIIICGNQTSDSSTGQVPFQLSEALGIPLITDIFSLEIEKKILKCHRNFGHESQNIEVNLPVLIRTINHSNNPRFVNLLGIKKGFEKKIQIFNYETFNCPEYIDGYSKSPTRIVKIEKVEIKRKNKIVEGNLNEKIQIIIQLLKESEIYDVYSGK
ncbi:MAG: electron transfer flavoprotein subunit beta/FixA family protein [Promethearchaeota archaeon]